jgi:hypothetical protein
LKRLFAAACLVFAGTIGVTVFGQQSSNTEVFDSWKDFTSRVQQGYEIAPVRLRLRGLNPFLVGLGSYIVNAQGGCNDCHTNPPYAEGGDPFMGEPLKINAEGYLAGGMPFGPFTSRNLTPRANGLPANLTFAEFRETLRTGKDLKDRHPQISPLLQVMPWPVYGKMTDLDLLAVYEFLKAIPSLPTPTPPPLTPSTPALPSTPSLLPSTPTLPLAPGTPTLSSAPSTPTLQP